ncbi:agamous-like MADS-box protein AGL80 [Hordeum vulgare subsp. vulgare]|uniref:MADS-box domain-containing protein n=1 Tax=Hordeum vulgare subsp. vulgare TaxID=112509 RepID=A0A8I7B2C2_HORVV|nr:agamous-like MADS-box protein AGL80 [Hordeum vulgare subsp. vulgare]
MARKKVALRYIRNSSTRRVTFEKRRNSLMKKAGDLGALCNTKACVLVYGEGASMPDVFPSHADAVAILSKYKYMPDLVQFKNTMSQEEFLIERITKLQEEANMFRCEREDREIRILLHKAMLGGSLDAHEVARVGPKLEVILKNLGDRITKISKKPPALQPHATYVTNNIGDVSSTSTEASGLA